MPPKCWQGTDKTIYPVWECFFLFGYIFLVSRKHIPLRGIKAFRYMKPLSTSHGNGKTGPSCKIVLKLMERNLSVTHFILGPGRWGNKKRLDSFLRDSGSCFSRLLNTYSKTGLSSHCRVVPRLYRDISASQVL